MALAVENTVYLYGIHRLTRPAYVYILAEYIVRACQYFSAVLQFFARIVGKNRRAINSAVERTNPFFVFQDYSRFALFEFGRSVKNYVAFFGSPYFKSVPAHSCFKSFCDNTIPGKICRKRGSLIAVVFRIEQHSFACAVNGFFSRYIKRISITFFVVFENTFYLCLSCFDRRNQRPLCAVLVVECSNRNRFIVFRHPFNVSYLFCYVFKIEICFYTEIYAATVI